MAASSVTGSFRGIEVSFTFNGPHIVMSVLNKAEEGRRLRVMFQQQPLSGRVNWTAFQLSGQKQKVVVPLEVIQSHKLAFYVDNHEPISTYTEKILEELKQIQDQHLVDNQSNGSAPESDPQLLQHSQDERVETTDLDEIHKQENEVKDITPEKEPEVPAPVATPQIADNLNTEQKIDELDSTASDLEVPISLDSQGTSANQNGDGNHIVPLENVSDETVPEVESEVTPISTNGNAVDESISTLKEKKKSIGQYIPSASAEIQFSIKVPAYPKSASKQHTTFIPPRPASTSKSNGKKHGFFGQLAGTFGFTLPKRKEYYVQQNKHIYDKFHANLESLESAYNNGCGISLDNWDLESLSEREIAVLLLNLMVNELSEWKKAAKQGDATKDTLAKSLETIEGELKETLKQTRGIEAPSPTLFPDRTASTDKDLMDIQRECDKYLQRFSKKLAVLEQKHAEKVKVPAFKRFLVEFVKDKLFPSVAEFSSLNMVQSRLNWFLNLIDYELMPIEPGKTKFSPEFHELKEKCSSEYEPDTIVEVVSPGLQSKDGKRVIQNAVVVQAE